MKFKKIVLRNFRQYLGTQEIEFSTDPEKNVTVVHAENGVGKTTLLNAVHWCFYGTLVEGENNRLLSKETNENICSVELFVEIPSEGSTTKIYKIMRSINRGDTEPKISMGFFEDGFFNPNAKYFDEFDDYKPTRIDHPNVLINRWLPSSMSEYFFFSGENSERFKYTPDERKSNPKLVKAIRNILGLTYLEVVIEDLKVLKQKLEKAKSESLKKNKELQIKFDRSLKLKELIESREKKAKNEEANAKNFQREIDDISNQLLSSNSDQLKSLETEHRQLTLSKRNVEDQLSKLDVQRQQLVKEYGAQIFAYKRLKTVKSFVKEAREFGLPAPYEDTLITKVTEAGECICGRELIEGTEAYNNVLKLRNEASNAEIQQRTSMAEAMPSHITRVAQDFLNKIQSIAKDKDQQEKYLDQIEADLTENQEKQYLCPKIEIDVEALNRKRSELKKAKSDSERVVLSAEIDIKRWNDELSTLNRSSAQTEAFSKVNEVVNSKLSLIEEIIDYSEENKNTLEREGRSNIYSHIKDFLSQYFNKNYKFTLSDDYSFGLQEKVEGEDGTPFYRSIDNLGEGENRLLNLAFISALTKTASERVDNKQGLALPGATAPFVVDAPFGQLAAPYQKATAESLQKNVGQLILFLSSSHWTHVQEVIKPYIGKEIVLVNNQNMPDSSKDKEKEGAISINGTEYLVNNFSSDINYTEVKQVI